MLYEIKGLSKSWEIDPSIGKSPRAMSLSYLVLPPFSQGCAPYTALEYLGLEADFDVHLAETLTALSSHPSLHR